MTDDMIYVHFETSVTVDDPDMTETDWAELGRFVAFIADDNRLQRDDPEEWRHQMDERLSELNDYAG